jgi:LexA DNA binding domain
MSPMRCSTISTNCSPVSGNLHRRVPLEEWPEFRLVAWWTMKKTYTDKQGQYLAFIYYYSKIHGCSPSEAEMQQYFRVSPPAVHQMIVTLEVLGFITRTRGQARSIHLLISREELPDLI